MCKLRLPTMTLLNEHPSRWKPHPLPGRKTEPVDPGSVQGSDEIHLTQSVRWQQQHRPLDYKQMEFQRNGSLQTICMTRCSFSIIALSIAITMPVKPAIPFFEFMGG